MSNLAFNFHSNWSESQLRREIKLFVACIASPYGSLSICLVLNFLSLLLYYCTCLYFTDDERTAKGAKWDSPPEKSLPGKNCLSLIRLLPKDWDHVSSFKHNDDTIVEVGEKLTSRGTLWKGNDDNQQVSQLPTKVSYCLTSYLNFRFLFSV